MAITRCDNFFSAITHGNFWHGVGWAAGLSVLGIFIVSLVRQVLATGKLLRSLSLLASAAVPPRLAALIENKQINNIRIFASDQSKCFCVGFFKPQIYLSTSAASVLTEAELLAVLSHERHHQQSYDPLMGALLHAARTAFWFLPIVADFEKRWLAAREVAADAAAQNGEKGKISLVSALIKLSGRPSAPAAFFGFAEQSTLAIRIAVLEGRGLKFAPLTLTKIFVSVMVLAILLAAFVPSTKAQTVAVLPCSESQSAESPMILNPIHKIPYNL
ncbi:MAG: peptidase, M56 domain protein [Candidatus Magasanikbacteria bacterium]|nr:peptidase, M56 domain protein [Candidatus Magasanikbacteria bacterium]